MRDGGVFAPFFPISEITQQQLGKVFVWVLHEHICQSEVSADDAIGRHPVAEVNGQYQLLEEKSGQVLGKAPTHASDVLLQIASADVVEHQAQMRRAQKRFSKQRDVPMIELPDDEYLALHTLVYGLWTAWDELDRDVALVRFWDPRVATQPHSTRRAVADLFVLLDEMRWPYVHSSVRCQWC